MKIEERMIGEWKMNFSDKEIVLPSNFQRQLEYWAGECSNFFPKENSLVQREFGIHSLFVRFDCTLGDDGDVLYPYECEDRPRGLGVTSELVPGFRDRLSDLKKNWPTFGFVDGSRKKGDDYLWLESYDTAKHQGVLCRGEPDEMVQYEYRSISTSRMEGDKSYGVSMGWWRLEDMVSNLNWEEDFVVKPLTGCMSRDMFIWAPSTGKVNGTSTKTKIQNALSSKEGFYVQPFHRPLSIDGLNTIFRVFCGFNTVTRKYEYLGGLWMGRNNLIIHGASDSITGPVPL